MAMAKARVLIVDDEAVSRAVIRDLLETAGYELIEATDGGDGLRIAESIHPDVILLDVLMPGVDGFEVCRSLKENPATQHIPVIFVTMVEEVELNRHAFDAGGTACILKPVRRETLLSLIAAALASANRCAESATGHEGDGQ